jgi:hypothetical protein
MKYHRPVIQPALALLAAALLWENTSSAQNMVVLQPSRNSRNGVGAVPVSDPYTASPNNLSMKRI